MYDEPTEEPTEHALRPDDRAREKSDEFRTHAELAAVFEGHRKFDAEIRPGLEAQVARDVQRTVAKLEKAKTPDSPVLPEPFVADAAALLDRPNLDEHLTTNDYHVHRRPGEAMIVRWLQGPQVEMFYERIQAHFDAAMNAFREDEHQQQEW